MDRVDQMEILSCRATCYLKVLVGLGQVGNAQSLTKLGDSAFPQLKGFKEALGDCQSILEHDPHHTMACVLSSRSCPKPRAT